MFTPEQIAALKAGEDVEVADNFERKRYRIQNNKTEDPMWEIPLAVGIPQIVRALQFHSVTDLLLLEIQLRKVIELEEHTDRMARARKMTRERVQRHRQRKKVAA